MRHAKHLAPCPALTFQQAGVNLISCVLLQFNAILLCLPSSLSMVTHVLKEEVCPTIISVCPPAQQGQQ